MSEGFPGPNPNFGSLAEAPMPSPEKKRDDDDDEEQDSEHSPTLFELPKKLEKEEKPKDNKPEADSAEHEVPLEKLAEDEKLLVVSALKEEAQVELDAAPQGSAEEIEALVVVTDYEVIEEAVKNGQTVEGAVESSTEATLDIAGIEAEELEKTEQQAVDPEAEVQILDEMVEDEPADDKDGANSATTSTGGNPPTPPAPPVPPYGPTPPGGGPGGPNNPYQGPRRPSSPSGPSGPHGPGFNPNTATYAAQNTTPNSSPNSMYSRRRLKHPLLVGGIVGYMIGRRSGRIKTEKKLLPIQHKLEKQVTALEQKMMMREEKIRTAVRNQVKENPEMQGKIITRMQVLQELKHQKIGEQMPNSRDEKMPPVRPEKLGMLVMNTEKPILERIKTPETFKDAERMTRQELLAIASKIPIEQSTLKKLYEAGRLDDRGLQRIIRAYLRGESVERVIRENLRDAERTNLREVLPNSTSYTPAAHTSPNSQPGIPPITNPTEQFGQATPHNIPKRPDFQDNRQSASANYSPTNTNPRTIQTGLAVTALVAAVAVVIFFLAG